MNYFKNSLLIITGFIMLGQSAQASFTLPSGIISMGRNKAAIVVEKSSQRLFVYSYDKTLHEDMAVRCSTGKLKGRKMLSGDQKTPEGVYFFTGKYLEKDLSPVYGSFAFPVDYPNQMDTENGRTGYAIWLHGTDRDLKPRDSNGCVALENQSLSKVEKLIDLDFTPIIFVDKIRSTDYETRAAIKKQVHIFLKEWADSLQSGTYHYYLSLYSPDFAPSIGWWNTWRGMRKVVGNEFAVVLNNISIYQDGDYYVVLFEERLRHDGIEIKVGIKKMYLSKEDTGLKIRGENYKFIHYTETESKNNSALKKEPVLTAMSDVIERLDEKKIKGLKKRIKTRIAKWVKLWSAGDIASYSGFYSDDFFSSGMNKESWINKKKYLTKTYKYINVDISDVSVYPENDKIIVRFSQDYKSSGYSAVGNKMLVMVNEGKEWKIIQEIWKKS